MLSHIHIVSVGVSNCRKCKTNFASLMLFLVKCKKNGTVSSNAHRQYFLGSRLISSYCRWRNSNSAFLFCVPSTSKNAFFLKYFCALKISIVVLSLMVSRILCMLYCRSDLVKVLFRQRASAADSVSVKHSRIMRSFSLVA